MSTPDPSPYFGVPSQPPSTQQTPPLQWSGAYVAPNLGERVEFRGEALAAVATLLLVTLLGAPIGFVWAALRPSLDPYVVSMSAESALKPEFGADLTLAALGLGAGILVGVVAWITARSHGLGITIGLALGGVLAMIVAARTGMLAAHPADLYRDTNLALAKHGDALISPSDSKDFLDLLTFRLRSYPVVLAMTVTGPLVFGLLTVIRDRMFHPVPGRVSWGSAATGSAPELAQLSAWSEASAPAVTGSAQPAAGQRW